uniref:Uncharacterized protein n=1 Tax=Rhizoctonia solani TaxID=456999 RepID=N0A557_9AGAM|nr:hypothetical protein RSOL_m00460 [Rhizoctonia solani]AGK45380.1 hypothetical protein RSOL_m00460 [Rhizoctonia solani]
MKILKRKITALPGNRMVPIYRDHTALSVRTGPGRAGIYDASSKESFFNSKSFNLNNPVLSTTYRW